MSDLIKRVLAFVVLTSTVVVFSGCATVFKGNSQDLTINSTPSGALVRLSTG